MVTTGQEMVGEKNFFKVRGKSGNFTSSQWKFYEHESSLVMKLINKLMVGFQKS